MVTEAYPLQWPSGWKREKTLKRSAFQYNGTHHSLSKALTFLQEQLRLFNAKNTIVSSNLELRLDGLPYKNQRQPNDLGVAVYFNWNGEQKAIACDKFDRIACNIWALAKTIEAMRGIERWGATELMTKAFSGFTALPESTQSQWWEILEVCPTATDSEIKTSYRKLVKEYHPDVSGDDTHFKKIKQAYEMTKTT